MCTRRLACASVGAIALISAACHHRPASIQVDDGGWGPSLGREATPAELLVTAPPPELIPAAERVRWSNAELLSALEEVPGREPSEHAASSYERTVLVNDAAAGYRDRVHAPLPPGALIAQRHHLPGQHEVAFWFLMHKLAPGSRPPTGDWEFLVLDPDLKIAASGELRTCARCHLEAPRDSTFGPPGSGL